MTKINRTPVRPVARRIASRYLSRTVLLFAIAHGFGQQSPDAKTAVTLSVICASNFVRTARTAIVLVPRHRQRPSCGAIFIEGGPRLSKVFFGGIKKMKIQRLVLVGDDKSTTLSMETILTVPIKAGIPAGTRIVFPEEGDQGPTKIPADVIFVTEDRPHETFRREGSDLHTTVDIFLREALTGTVITLNTVDDRTLRIPITSIVTPNYTKRVRGEGMPFPANPKQKGDLILSFSIEFPVYLPLFNKNRIKKAFEVFRAGVENAEYVHRLILASKMRRNVDDNVPLRRGANDEADRLKFICET